MVTERKLRELHNRLDNCYKSTSIQLRIEEMWSLFVWTITDGRANSAGLLNKSDDLVSKYAHIN